MKDRRKTKMIDKELRKNKKKRQPTDQAKKGQPQLKSLSDFVTALTPVYVSRPIYTGGRLVCAQGKIFASCNQDVSVFDLGLRSSLPSIKLLNEQIVNFAVNPLATKIATYSENGLMRIIDTASSTVLQITKMNHKLFPNDMAFSKDGKYLAVGFASQSVRIFTVQSLKETHHYQHSAPLKKVEWHPSTEMLQVVSSDFSRQIFIFDYIANKPIAKVDGGSNFCFTPSGKQIVTIHDQQLRVYLLKGLQFQFSFKTEDYIETLHCVGDSVLFGGQESELYAWKIGTEIVRTIPGGSDSGVMKIVGWEKERKSLVVSSEQNITVIDNARLTVDDVIVGFNDEIIDIKFSKTEPSDYFLMITNSPNPKIVNKNTHALHCLLQGHKQIVLCGQYWHPWIVTAGKDKVIKLWKINEVGKPRLVANYKGHADDVCGIALMRNSHLLVSVGEDKTIKLWPLCDVTSETIEIHSALATVMGHQKTINAVRVSVKDQLIATCSHDRSVRVWDKELRRLFTLTGHRRGVWDAAFHEKEALLVTAGGDGMLKGWSMIDGGCVWSMGEGAGLVRCQWIYEHQVVTGSVDGVLKLWDIRKKTSLSYDKHEGKIWALQVHKTQNNKCEIATGANDSTYQIWMDSTEQTRARILKEGEQQQKQKILLEQYKYNKEYLEAAKIAFDSNYPQMLIQVLEEMLGGVSEDRNIDMDEEGQIIEEGNEIDEEQLKNNLQSFVEYACQQDFSRLLTLVLTMNSTVRHFKAAHRLFIQILRVNKLKGLLNLNRSFVLPQAKEEWDSKESDFERFLKIMLTYTQKHHNRIEKYIRGSYWIDHLQHIQNPIGM